MEKTFFVFTLLANSTSKRCYLLVGVKTGYEKILVVPKIYGVKTNKKFITHTLKDSRKSETFT